MKEQGRVFQILLRQEISKQILIFVQISEKLQTLKTPLTNKYTKGTFHAKTGTIKDRNSKDLTEAEDIKMRWQEYTEELYKKDLHDPDNHNGVITHLEPDIMECEVKWTLESITMNKASGGYGIPVELFQILKEMGILDQLTCLLRNLYAGQEATVRTGHGTTDGFQIGKGPSSQ